MKIFWILIVTVTINLAHTGKAAEFAVLSDLPLVVEERGSGKCTASLDGPIEPGDAQKVIDYVAQMAPFFDPGSSASQHFESYNGDGLNLCMSGPGGSFAEARKLIAALSEGFVWTIVPAGKQCLSACAVAFMGGVYAEEGSRAPARQLMPGADLGFHAPSINLQGDAPMPAAMVEAAYKTALADIHGIMELLVSDDAYEASMRPSLLASMLATPPDQMFHLTTIDEIGRWNISFDDGDNDSLNLSEANLIQVCRNMSRWRFDHSSQSTADLSSNGQFGMVRVEQVAQTSQYDKTELWKYVLGDSMFNTECIFHIPPDMKRISDNSIQVEVWQEDEQTRGNFWPDTWQYLNPEMTLAEAAERAKAK